MRRPKGIKTKKSAAKRFKITATGKVQVLRVVAAATAGGRSTRFRSAARSRAASSVVPEKVLNTRCGCTKFFYKYPMN
jgi:ribosomal protein L35